jgi:hypothetical protein
VVVTLFGLPDEQAAVASDFYVDVPSESFPDGATRGQLRDRTLAGHKGFSTRRASVATSDPHSG